MKKLFLALLTTLLLLVAASAALADSPSNYICIYCDVPCTRWVPVNYEGRSYHMPVCDLCGNLWLEDLDRLLCTHLEGSATCTTPAVCSICGYKDYYGSEPDPNAHDISDFYYTGAETHYRYCLNGCYTKFDEGPHTGGTATCADYPTCTVCDKLYGSPDPNNHDWGKWVSKDDGTHIRTCANNPRHTETEDCTGGTATCTEDGVCEDCGGAYIPATDHSWGEWVSQDDDIHIRTCQHEDCDEFETGSHQWEYYLTCTAPMTCIDCSAQGDRAYSAHDWDEYQYFDADGHVRYCKRADCTGQEYQQHGKVYVGCGKNLECPECGAKDATIAKHIPGPAATCTTNQICTRADCGAVLTKKLGHAYGQWKSNGNSTHTRTCANDPTHTETEVCTGGTATCTEGGVCVTCSGAYIPAIKHNWGEWKPNGDDTHTRVCANDASHTETEACSGGNTTCTGKAICTVCGGEHGDVLGHAYGEWKSNGDGTHTRVCANDASHTENEDCTGGKATCTEDGVCVVCDAAYIPAIKHNWGEWKPNGDDTHTRVCKNDAKHTETEDCSGGTATCTTKAICEVCGSEHGAVLGHIPGAEADCTNDQICIREGCGELLAEKLGHDYTAVVTKPTCTKQGYTTYTCSRCEDSYEADQTAACGHWYDLWYPNQDGTHSAECKRYGCSHEETTECTLYEITVKDGEAETVLTVCPVCGDHKRAIFDVVSGTAIKNVYINHPLPRGEQIVRELDAPFDGVLYAFTAAYESAGREVSFNEKVSVSLPLDAEKYAGFKLVRVDVTPATETTERIEVWTDVAFTYENGRLTFETYAAGLFLLVPIE